MKKEVPEKETRNSRKMRKRKKIGAEKKNIYLYLYMVYQSTNHENANINKDEAYSTYQIGKR